MNYRSFYSRVRRRRGTDLRRLAIIAVLIGCCCGAPSSSAGNAPGWMHAAANTAVPAHRDDAPAVVLYAEDILNVQANGKIKQTERRVYKILRPSGKDYGIAIARFDAETRVTSMKAWCIPAQGKDYEVKENEAIETGLTGVQNGELATDLRSKILAIPASDPGNIVGYEIEQELRPYILQDNWEFQDRIPTAEAKYTLLLPSGWEYKATFINHGDIAPVSVGNNQWQWSVKNVPELRPEEEMPPWRSMTSQMVMALVPPGGSQTQGFQNWKEMGVWEFKLTQGRRDASPDIKQKVVSLTAKSPTMLAKMRALAKFVQGDIRYVAIELGIGGLQPHQASDIYSHRYGDCKDKATLMSSMLREIGVESYYLDVNTERGGAAPDRPAMLGWFNHEILAVKLPADVSGPSVAAVVNHPILGRLLIFDPTDEYTQFGEIRGALQNNYGLLLSGDGGELLQLPMLKTSASGIRRTAKLAISAKGTLSGEFREVQVGDPATQPALRAALGNRFQLT